ncbi:DUF6708 domain-containing protein [Massilia aurea]|uniref:DUF6708 domain-containing protein n=1 Tax=Massilia aurea TaxID=373040 RepID=UPI0011CDC683|nr:DUF6708 domain-containing protein [Massilia aurea]
MNYFGLFPRYQVNRPLSKAELNNQLAQKEKLDIEPYSNLCVIKMNSTFLESVDKWYAWRGSLSVFALPPIVTVLVILAGMILEAFAKSDGLKLQSYDIETMLALTMCLMPMFFIGIWLLRKEWFSLTHYPVRFNRKKQLVHVFHTDGTVSTTPWDEIFFTLGHMPRLHDWEIRGHILDPNTSLIQRTFSLSYTGPLYLDHNGQRPKNLSEYDLLLAHWEFIRRYMEEGPDAVSCQVQFCMPLDGRKESIRIGIERMLANIACVYVPVYLMMLPLCAIFSLNRIFAMCTSKIPEWPSEVEADCSVENDDPYAITGNQSGDRVAVYPEAAAAAGVEFRPRRIADGRLKLRPSYPSTQLMR